MKRIHIATCDNYDLARVRAAVSEAVDGLGGIESFIRAGQRVLIKPNLLRPARPDQHVSTHPALVRAVAEMVLACGAQAIIADSPGGPHNRVYLRTLLATTGISQVAAETGAICSDDMSTQVISFPDGQVAKRIDVLGIAVDADAVISLPKLKTHGLTMMTCAVKNMFGTVPGLSKMLYHSKWPELSGFSQMLLDVHQRRPPDLTIIDGIWGMEGNGPSAGTPRPVGVILAANDGIAADLVASKIIGIDRERIPTLTAAIDRGLIEPDLSDVELSGAPLAQVAVNPPFALPATANESRRGLISRVSQVLPLHALSAYPEANGRCTGCGTCARACPAEAISIVDRVARMNLDVCIRCYCCHELCPHDAIDLKKGLLAKVLMGRS